MKYELTIIPSITIHPNQINLYNEIHWNPTKSRSRTPKATSLFDVDKYEHLKKSSRSADYKVSDIAKRKMMRSLDYFLLITNPKTYHNQVTGRLFKFKLAFVTLTLPSKQIHSDNQIKSECLNQLLIEVKKVYKVRNYIWRAEKQENGNIHFHLVVDKFIPYQELRDRWNRIINKLGYVDRYKEEQIHWHKDGFKVRTELLKTWSKEKQYQAYLRGSKIHWNSPNSTDIHAITKIHNLKLYISKYLTKNDNDNLEKLKNLNPEIHKSGRIWGCSTQLSDVKGCRVMVDSRIEEELKQLELNSQIFKISKPYFTVIYFNFSDLQKGQTPALFKLFSQYLLEKFDYSIQTRIAA